GFVGVKDDKKIGQYGLEGYFEEELGGVQGFLSSEKDVAGRWIPISGREWQKAEDGADIVITIDRNIEYFACGKLEEAVKRHDADGGTVVIMDPKTGAILAMCSYPNFNPNEYAKVEDINIFNNPTIFYQYEPGSIFKAITIAAALDTGKIAPTTTYVDEGEIKVDDRTIKNSDLKAYGTQTMTQVLENSLNTGSVFAVSQIGPEIFKKYVEDFGFGEKTGVELDFENAGNINSLSKRGKIWSATGSFGQGISVTPIQIVAAFSAIANGGKLVKPYIVDRIIKSDGEVIKTEPKVIHQAISGRTSTLLGGMLVSVIENGHGKKAGVQGYYVAGKTGTAQVAKKDGSGYEKDVTIGSFVGFAPVEDPKFVMLTKIDHPRSTIWAEATAAPLFGEIAKFMLNYLKVPPSR
ncbi:MAG: peptidoglycan D,D-transpeptidase FtsI family protein, partial [Patescibacteria group bacterium]